MIATGIVVALFTVDRRAAPMKKVEQLYALAGRGIEGDRYFLGTGTYSKSPEPGRQVTLIKSEVLESLKNKLEINVKPEESRRNILTQGIEINNLIGTEFYVGTVRLRATGSPSHASTWRSFWINRVYTRSSGTTEASVAKF